MRHVPLLVLITLAGCSGSSTARPDEACSANAGCSAGSICLDGQCFLLCTIQAHCPAGTLCGPDGVCLPPVAGDPPTIATVIGNNAADPTRVMDGIVVSGTGLGNAVFEVQDTSSLIVALDVRSQTATSAELVFPADVLSGEYSLVATNAAGSTQTPVTLTLPDLTGDQIVSKLNDTATTGVIDISRLPVGTTADTVAAGSSVLTEADVEGFISNDSSMGAVPYNAGHILADSSISQDSSGRIGIGTTTPGGIDPTSTLTVQGTAGGYGQVSAISHRETDPAGVLKTFGARGTATAPAALQDRDRFGLLLAHGYDGETYDNSASVEFRVDGTPAGQMLPSKIAFYTSQQGETSRASRMVITHKGDVGVGTTSPAGRFDVDIGYKYAIAEQFDDNPANATYDNRCDCAAEDDAFTCPDPYYPPADQGTLCYDVNTTASPNIREYRRRASEQNALRVSDEGLFSTLNSYPVRYHVNTATPTPILDRVGNPIPANTALLMSCAVQNTNASGTAIWMVKRWGDDRISVERIASFGSTTSNTPEVFNDGGVLSIRLYNHASFYTVSCWQTRLNF